jgi:hypothetical protein
MPADNTFNFVLAPSAPVKILVIDSGAQASSSLYLSRALAIGTAPAFEVEVVPVTRVTPATFDRRSVVILNDTVFPSAGGNGVLKQFVERGGGLLVVFGEHSGASAGDPELLPGKAGAVTDPANGRGGSIGFIDYSHPVFEVFKAPRSGDFSSAHIFRYRAFESSPGARVIARFDDGAVAAAERRIGAGRVIAWTSTLDDSWSDVAVKPVYLPLVHQLVRYLAHYEQPVSWLTVGQVLDLAASSKSRGDRVVVTPAGQRLTQAAGAPGLLELNEQGIYEVRGSGTAASAKRPEALAVNLDPAESDLTPIDTRELVAAVTGRASPVAAPPLALEATQEDAEKHQALWWYLLFAGLLLLATETVIANRLSRNERFL